MTMKQKEVYDLMTMVGRAIANYNLETCFDGDEISLNDEITLDSCDDEGNLVVYAVTSRSVITTKGQHINFFRLDRDDIFSLQDIIHDEYDIDYITA